MDTHKHTSETSPLLSVTGEPTYHAVLRHADQVGDESPRERRRERGGRGWSGIYRVGAGLAVSSCIAPAAFVLARMEVSGFVPLAVITTLGAVLGAYAGYVLTRRDMRVWVERMARRTESLFQGKAVSHSGETADVERYMDDLAESMEHTLERQLRHERDTIISVITSLVSALEARDPHTRNHSARVAKFAVRLGREMGLEQAPLYELHLGGLLHDVGKIGIPDSILLKPAGLTRDEYEIMKSHSLVGARILSGIPGLENVSDIVLQHHEMMNGRGYPQGLAGDEICLGARIIAVADTYMSMVEDRPYRQGMSLARVMKEIRRVAGHQLDANVVDALQAMLTREVDTYGTPLEGHFNDLDSEAA